MVSAFCSWICSHYFILSVGRKWGFVHPQSQECLLLWVPPTPLPLWGKEQWCCTECRQPQKWVCIAKSRRIKRIYALRCTDFYFPPSYFLPLLALGCVWSTLGAFLSPCAHSSRTGRDNQSHLNSARWKSPMSASHGFTSKCLGSDSRLVP